MEYNAEDDKFGFAYSLKQRDLTESQIPLQANSAVSVLLHKDNRHLVLCKVDGEEVEQKGLRVGNTLNNTATEPAPYHTFQNRVEQIYESLEKIIDHEIDANNQAGVKLKLRARRYLEGWDFKDLATDNDPFYSRVSTLQTFGKGWVDFTRSIHAITLFGRGFGSLIRPTEGSLECKYWSKLPAGKFYLAASGMDLKQILDIYGDAYSHPLRISDNIIWPNPRQIGSQCQCASSKRRFPFKRTDSHTGLAQVLLPCSAVSSHGSSSQPRWLPDNAAFAFGHNINFPWHYRDSGDPEYGMHDIVDKGNDTDPKPMARHDTGLSTDISSVGIGELSDNSELLNISASSQTPQSAGINPPLSSPYAEEGSGSSQEDGDRMGVASILLMLTAPDQRPNLSQPTLRHEYRILPRKRPECDHSDDDMT